MRINDPGHDYELESYDGYLYVPLRFMKREGPAYPGNVGKAAGTNCQEVIRVLIDRVKYLDNQVPCQENKTIVANLRSALIAFENRAIRRHGLKVRDLWPDAIELLQTCKICGHIRCAGHFV